MLDFEELAAAGRDPRIDYFNRLAENWDSEEPSAALMAAKLEAQQDLLRFSSGLRLLEIGCGTGKTTTWLAAKVGAHNVTAVDFAPRMLEIALAKGIAAEFRCVDVCLQVPGQQEFDVVFCYHCFPHFRDQSAALANLAAALKPAGRLIVMHTAGRRRINEFHAGVSGPVSGDLLPAADEWPELLATAGLELVELIDRDDLYFLEARLAASD
ncbi:methyltransferase domain-containing protein [bacterium]|nr:methyltransferase domain-containing protein [bacterium]